MAPICKRCHGPDLGSKGQHIFLLGKTWYCPSIQGWSALALATETEFSLKFLKVNESKNFIQYNNFNVLE